MGNPPQITSASPRATFIMPSVGMNGCGRCSLVSSKPLTLPSAPPIPSAASTASAGGTPAFSSNATNTQLSPRMEPTDRSMPAVIITTSCPSESSALTADCRNTLIRLSKVRK